MTGTASSVLLRCDVVEKPRAHAHHSSRAPSCGVQVFHPETVLEVSGSLPTPMTPRLRGQWPCFSRAYLDPCSASSAGKEHPGLGQEHPSDQTLFYLCYKAGQGRPATTTRPALGTTCCSCCCCCITASRPFMQPPQLTYPPLKRAAPFLPRARAHPQSHQSSSTSSCSPQVSSPESPLVPSHRLAEPAAVLS